MVEFIFMIVLLDPSLLFVLLYCVWFSDEDVLVVVLTESEFEVELVSFLDILFF